MAIFYYNPSPYGIASLKGAQEEAKLGIQLDAFDANNNPQLQTTQIQDAITTGKYKAFWVWGIEPRRYGLVQWRQMRAQYDELISQWGFEFDATAKVGTLRTADKQKVEILRAVASDARVLVMDEPTSSLTSVETKTLHRMIRTLRERGRTIVYVSHFLDEVLELADTVTVLRGGRLRADRARDAGNGGQSRRRDVRCRRGGGALRETARLDGTGSPGRVRLAPQGRAQGHLAADPVRLAGSGQSTFATTASSPSPSRCSSTSGSRRPSSSPTRTSSTSSSRTPRSASPPVQHSGLAAPGSATMW
jgi:hypothetical protein